MPKHKENISFWNLVPENSIPILKKILEKDFVNIETKNQRKGFNNAFGVFISNNYNRTSKIRIVNNFQPYTTLLLIIHEYAHFLTWKYNKRKVKPHGKEWKENFMLIADIFIENNIFPEEIKNSIKKYYQNITASTLNNEHITKSLVLYENLDYLPPQNSKLVGDFKEGDIFTLSNGKQFKMLERKRVRCLCKCIENGRLYWVRYKIPVRDN